MENRYVAVIILQYSNYKATIECIESVQRYNSYPVKYIVVDNASPDEGLSADKVVEYLGSIYGDTVLELVDGQQPETPLPHATVVRSKINDGYARGNNKGLALSFADEDIKYVLILNNDTLFVEDIIPSLVTDIDILPKCALVTPLLFKRDLCEIDYNCARFSIKFRSLLLNNFSIFRTIKYVRRPDLNSKNNIIDVQIISGSCMMGSKKIFKQIDGFDPGTFLYYEENILWEKLKRLDLKNYVDLRLKCIHLGASTTRNSHSMHIIKCSLKSQYYFINKYHRYRVIKLPILKISHFWVLSVLYIRNIFRWRL